MVSLAAQHVGPARRHQHQSSKPWCISRRAQHTLPNMAGLDEDKRVFHESREHRWAGMQGMPAINRRRNAQARQPEGKCALCARIASRAPSGRKWPPVHHHNHVVNLHPHAPTWPSKAHAPPAPSSTARRSRRGRRCASRKQIQRLRDGWIRRPGRPSVKDAAHRLPRAASWPRSRTFALSSISGVRLDHPIRWTARPTSSTASRLLRERRARGEGTN